MREIPLDQRRRKRRNGYRNKFKAIVVRFKDWPCVASHTLQRNGVNIYLLIRKPFFFLFRCKFLMASLNMNRRTTSWPYFCGWLIIEGTTIFSFPLSVGLIMHQQHPFQRGKTSSSQMECPGCDTKIRPMVRFDFWSAGAYGVTSSFTNTSRSTLTRSRTIYMSEIDLFEND